MKRSSRMVGVVGGGVGGFLVAGPVGAVAGGVAGGLAMDGVTTGLDSAIHDEYRPSGTIKTVTKLVDGKSKSVSGDIFDLVYGTAMDGLGGFDASTTVVRGKLQGTEDKVAMGVPSPKVPQGVAHFDYLVIGDTPGALASAKEAAKLGKRVAVVIVETESYKHYTGVQLGSEGYIPVGGEQNTNVHGVYALGPVTGKELSEKQAVDAGTALADRLFGGH